jgi:hypothetical protein
MLLYYFTWKLYDSRYREINNILGNMAMASTNSLLGSTTLNHIYPFYVYNMLGSHSTRARNTRFVFFFCACFYFILISNFYRNLIDGITIPRTRFYRWRGKTASWA